MRKPLHHDKVVAHGEEAFDPVSKAFLALLNTLGFTQFVHESTCCSGNTLSSLTVSPVISDVTSPSY